MARINKGDDEHGYHIAALARGLAVLDAFGPGHHELTLKEVAEAVDVTPPSALRIGYTLIEAGFLVRNPSTKGYRLGPHALSVGLETLSSMTLPEIAEPYLVALRDSTDETVKLAIPTGTDVMIVARVASLSHPGTTNYIGSSVPMTLSSLGRAVLAWQPAATINAVLAAARTIRLTPKTMPKARLRQELEATRQRGYALNDQGTTVEQRSIAAPLLDASGRAIGALNLSVSAQRFSLSELERRLAPDVVRAARAVSSVLPPQVQGAGQFALP